MMGFCAPCALRAIYQLYVMYLYNTASSIRPIQHKTHVDTHFPALEDSLRLPSQRDVRILKLASPVPWYILYAMVFNV